jgi:hypothetical protein
MHTTRYQHRLVALCAALTVLAAAPAGAQASSHHAMKHHPAMKHHAMKKHAMKKS